MMIAVEFEIELEGKTQLALPEKVASQLPKTGHARVIILLKDEPDQDCWRSASYSQFMKEDDSEDAVYDRYM